MPEAQLIERRDQSIRLRDGRTLGYAEYGSPTGRALFYFHGHPGARLEAAFLAGPAAEIGVRLIGVDRPGMGLSSFKAGRCVIDWPDDVTELADALGIDRFAVAGFSGGGPYAAACAYKLPDRLTTCGLIAGVGAVSPFVSFLSGWVPWLMMPPISRMFSDAEKAEKALANAARRWNQPDRDSLRTPGVQTLMAASLAEAFRQGSRGPAYEGTLYGRSWGFPLEAIISPVVHLWHGALDQEVGVDAARAVAGRIAGCAAAFYPDEGHISVIVNHAREIVETLAA